MKHAEPRNGEAVLQQPRRDGAGQASTEPTDRSMPPVRMISVMPIDRQRFTEICRRMFRPLSVRQELSVSSDSGDDHQRQREQRLEARRGCAQLGSVILMRSLTASPRPATPP